MLYSKPVSRARGVAKTTLELWKIEIHTILIPSTSYVVQNFRNGINAHKISYRV